MFGGLIKKIFGDSNQKMLKIAYPLVEKTNALEEEFAALSDAQLVEKTAALKARLAAGESLDDILPDAFANAREAARRTIGLRAFDTQLIGGILLHRGNIAEMKTGEGKTLAAAFPAYLNALNGRGVHIVTVNDYLAKRDTEWMGLVYKALGLSVGVIYAGQDEAEKQAAYDADITYGTNNEFGFDYLRDNMRASLDDMCQRAHAFAIVDEVDSILIDEARTPLIISGPAEDKSALYQAMNAIIPEFLDAHIVIDEKRRSVVLTEAGNDFAEARLRKAGLLGDSVSLYDPESAALVHHISQALVAAKLYARDTNYIVNEGRVVLIDEFTGRMMPGRRLSDGLHQAIEAKEGVNIQDENTTLASITFQNYFRMYQKLSGMTGTAQTEAEEFLEIYNLGVVVIPTHLPVIRIDENDEIYRTKAEKYDAVVQRIKESHDNGQPILVGTTSIEKSEMLSAMLKKNKIKHNILNARQHEKEALIIAEAGRFGAVTIATNMAGRGTDIQLGGNPQIRFEQYMQANPDAAEDTARAQIDAEVDAEKAKVIAAGGLYVLATERHESRRIDNQLRGRSGRQGDPGRSSFFLSLEDDLMRIFGSERLDRVLSTLGMKQGEAIEHPWINKSLEKAQAKVESHNFDIRKQLLKFDDVMNDQRRVIFAQRHEIMAADTLSEQIADMRYQYIDELVAQSIPENSYPDQWDMDGLHQALRDDFLLDVPVGEWAEEDGVDEEQIVERICNQSDTQMAEKEALFGADIFTAISKQLFLETLDRKWREHLLMLEHLRGVVGWRGYAQRDPLNEYKTEAFQLFEGLLEGMRRDITTVLAKIRPMTEAERQAALLERERMAHAAKGGASARNPAQNPAQNPSKTPVENPSSLGDWGKVPRNQPCPCGSGRKYKHCHGKLL